ncbi:MAG: helix-turn-helix domain-containing protein [Syntrophobacteraceae bacterium]
MVTSLSIKIPHWKLSKITNAATHMPMAIWYERAKIIMEDRKLTQAAVAEKMGESKPNVNRVLKGGRGADSLAWALKFAVALDWDPADLLFGSEYKRPIKKVSHKLLIEKLEKFEVYEKTSPLSKDKYVAIRLLKDSIAAGQPHSVSRQGLPHLTNVGFDLIGNKAI